jgi:hypothetical protein
MEHETSNLNSKSLDSVRKRFLWALYAIAITGGAWNAVRGYPPFMNTVMPILFVGVALATFVMTYRLTVRNVLASLAVVLLIFVAEVSGVNIGFPNGDYVYTTALGPKLFDVPLVIPLFWFALLIVSWSVSDRFLRYKNVVVAAIVVTAFDAVLEFAADSLGLWHWQGGMPTELAFISRFALAYAGLSLMKQYAAEKESDALLPHLLIIQLLYFVLSDIGIRFFSPLA